MSPHRQGELLDKEHPLHWHPSAQARTEIGIYDWRVPVTRIIGHYATLSLMVIHCNEIDDLMTAEPNDTMRIGLIVVNAP